MNVNKLLNAFYITKLC